MITSATSTDVIDASDFEPLDQSHSFKLNSTVYIAVTFSGQAGYSLVKLYRNNIFDINSQILTVHSGDTNAAFSFQINRAGQFVAGVYWCREWNCSNPVLAQVVHFSAS